MVYLKSKYPPRRRSLVRTIVSFIPEFMWRYLMTKPTHIYIHPSALGQVFLPNSEQNDDLNSFQSFSSYLQTSFKKPDLLLNSTPKHIKAKSRATDVEISAIQQELNLLKQQIIKIMEEKSKTTPEKTSLLVPPPVPPPLPTFPLAPPKINTTPVKTKPKETQIMPGFGGDLLKDLDKVKLKKVDKSPGGGPIKQKIINNEPADVLQAILRKRFNVMQNVSPDVSYVHEDDTFNVSYVDLSCNRTPSAAAE